MNAKITVIAVVVASISALGYFTTVEIINGDSNSIEYAPEQDGIGGTFLDLDGQELYCSNNGGVLDRTNQVCMNVDEKTCNDMGGVYNKSDLLEFSSECVFEWSYSSDEDNIAR